MFPILKHKRTGSFRHIKFQTNLRQVKELFKTCNCILSSYKLEYAAAIYFESFQTFLQGVSKFGVQSITALFS